MNKRYRKQMASIFLISMLSLVGCDQKNTNVSNEDDIQVVKQREPIEYTMCAVRKGDVAKIATIECNYMQTKSEEYSFRVDKQVVGQVYVTQGESVKKGDLLAEINLEDTEEALDNTRHDLAYQKLMLTQANELMESDLKTTRELYEVSSMKITDNTQKQEAKKQLQKDIENIKKTYEKTISSYQDQIDVDNHKIQSYEEKIENGRIYAGMDGTVSYIKLQLEHSMTKEDEPVIKIIDTSVCAFSSSQVEYKDYFKEGQMVEIALKDQSGTILQAYPMDIEKWDKLMYFKLSEKDFSIDLGAEATFDIETDSSRNTLYVDKRAVRSTDKQKYVYLIDEQGMKKVQYVETGIENGEIIEITSGLNEGDSVVLK